MIFERKLPVASLARQMAGAGSDALAKRLLASFDRFLNNNAAQSIFDIRQKTERRQEQASINRRHCR